MMFDSLRAELLFHTAWNLYTLYAPDVDLFLILNVELFFIFYFFISNKDLLI